MKFFALENDHRDETVINDTQDEYSDLDIHNELTEELENGSESISEAMESIKTLSKFHDLLSSSIKSQSGLDECSYEATRLSIEAIRIRLDMPSIDTKIPSIENFKSTSSRIASTKITLEAGVIDTIKNIWKGVIFHLKRIGENIVDWFRTYASVYKKYLSILDDYEKKVVTMNKKANIKKMVFTARSLSRQFTLNGTSADYESSKKLISYTKDVATNAIKHADNFVSFVKDLHKETSSNNFDLKKTFSRLKNIEDSLIKSLPTHQDPTTKISNRQSYGPFLGYEFVTTQIGVFKYDENGTEFVYYEVSNYHGHSTSKTIEPIPADKISEAIKLTKDYASSSLLTFEKYKSWIDDIFEISDFLEYLVSTSKWYIVTGEEEDRSRVYVDAIRRISETVMELITYIYLWIPRISFRGYRAMVRYIGLSLNNLEDPASIV